MTARETRSLVFSLLFPRGPSTVAGFVVAGRVGVAVERFAFRPWSEVREEVFEFEPALTDADPATAVVLERVPLRIPATH